MPPAVEPETRGTQEATIQDDEDVWETLDAPTASIGSAQNQTREAGVSSTDLQVSRVRNSPTDPIQTLQRRVETRRTIQQHLVQHPLQIFWSHFLWHLAREFWNLDVKIRIALLLLVMGAGCRIFILMTWYLWYPKMIIISLILLISYIYLYQDDIPRRLEAVFTALITLPNRLPQALEHMDIKQARRVFLVCFFIPTLLQTRTITLLADINATGGSSLWTVMVTLFMAGISAVLISPPRSKAARDISHICLVVLYGSALWITLCQFKIMTLPKLAAPFFLSTGTLLLAYDDNDNMEWCSGLARSALRQTLRDVLAGVGTSVQEDEMLQLAMLRWLVDYWSYTPPQQPQASNASTPNETTPSASAAPAAHTPNQELQWDELFPMLDTTTDQMTSEVQTLQQQQQQQGSPPPGQSSESAPGVGGSTTGSNNPAPADNSLNNLQNMLTSMNVDDRAKPAVEAYRLKVEGLPPTRDAAVLISIIRRCPACLAFLWQLLVASMFQPFATTLIILLMILPLAALDVIRIQAWATACESLSHMLDGSPDAPFEGATSQSTATEPGSPGFFSKILPDADPMTILLSGDDDVMLASVVTDTDESTTTVTTQVKIPTLLIVWRNAKASVGALEASLTAARCVQTGAIAVEFAQNVMSLAHLGNEVVQRGWMHGLAVIAKEVVFHHQGDINSAPRGSEATFTYAAVNAVRNGQRVAHNLGVLAAEDGQVGQIVGPIVDFFGFVGSLFDQNKGNEHNDEHQPEPSGTGEGSGSSSGAGMPTSDGNEPSSGLPLDDTKTQQECETPFSVADAEEDDEWESTAKKQESAKGAEGRDRTQLPGSSAQDDLNDAAPLTTEQEVTEEEETSPLSDVASAVEPQSKKASGEESQIKEGSLPESEEAGELPNAGGDPVIAKESESTPVDEPSAGAHGNSVDEPSVEAKQLKVESSKEELAPATPGQSKVDPKSEFAAPTAKVEQSNTSKGSTAQATVREEETTDELGVVMELIADASELSLIDESEKNEFLLKLSTNGKDKNFVAGMKATLQGLILESSQDQPAPGAGMAEVQSQRVTTVETVIERCVSPEEDAKPSGAVSESTISDDGWSPIVATAELEEATIQPLDYSDRIASAVRTREALVSSQISERELARTENDGIPTVASAPRQKEEDDDDNMWVKVGGGIALVGAALVGGAILAVNPNNSNRDRNENQTNRSGVTIERLDDEDGGAGGDEWERTAQ